MKYKPAIGLEVHVELSTITKCFCGCLNKFGDKPNANVCPVCLGLPGALPVLNKEVVYLATKAGLLLNCTIEKYSSFDRKNYFYPDLVKGYQITQFYHPIATKGYLNIEVNGSIKRINIKRIHIEEDAGKAIYTDQETLLDYNRSGVPLIEIVTEPDINYGEETKLFLKALKEALLHGDISDCKLEEGSFRVDVNISLSKTENLGVKTEIKNLNSFSNIEKAINEEVKRQNSILVNGGEIKEQTMAWNERYNRLDIMREKKDVDNYMYFPEYDLLPIYLDENYINSVREWVPQQTKEKKEHLESMGLTKGEVEILFKNKGLLEYYEKCCSTCNKPKDIFNLLTGEVARRIREKEMDFNEIALNPRHLCQFIELVDSGIISPVASKKVLAVMLETDDSPKDICKKFDLVSITDKNKVKEIIEKVVMENKLAVADYLRGQKKVLGHLIGKIMKESQGRINPQLAETMVVDILKHKGKDE